MQDDCRKTQIVFYLSGSFSAHFPGALSVRFAEAFDGHFLRADDRDGMVVRAKDATGKFAQAASLTMQFLTAESAMPENSGPKREAGKTVSFRAFLT